MTFNCTTPFAREARTPDTVSTLPKPARMSCACKAYTGVTVLSHCTSPSSPCIIPSSVIPSALRNGTTDMVSTSPISGKAAPTACPCRPYTDATAPSRWNCTFTSPTSFPNRKASAREIPSISGEDACTKAAYTTTPCGPYTSATAYTAWTFPSIRYMTFDCPECSARETRIPDTASMSPKPVRTSGTCKAYTGATALSP